MKRIIYILLIITICSIFLCGCYKDYYGRRPVDQKNTTWESEDGHLHFVVDKSGSGYGELIINDDKIKIEFVTGLGTTIWIYIVEENKEIIDIPNSKGEIVGQYEVRNEENKIEYWVGDYKNTNTFTATVEETTYFKPGQKIKINRIDN